MEFYSPSGPRNKKLLLQDVALFLKEFKVDFLKQGIGLFKQEMKLFFQKMY